MYIFYRLLPIYTKQLLAELHIKSETYFQIKLTCVTEGQNVN